MEYLFPFLFIVLALIGLVTVLLVIVQLALPRRQIIPFSSVREVSVEAPPKQEAASPKGDVPAPAAAPGKTDLKLPVHFATLSAAVAVAAFLFQIHQDNLSDIESKLDGIPSETMIKEALKHVDDRVQHIDDKISMSVDLAVAQQRTELAKQTEELRLLNADAKAQVGLLKEKVSNMDERIREIGVDRSIELSRYLSDIQKAKGGAEGGPSGDEDLLSDYAVRLLVRDGNMSSQAARAFASRAFLNPRGAEAQRLIALSNAAKDKGTGTVN